LSSAGFRQSTGSLRTTPRHFIPEAILAKNVKIGRFKPGMIKKYSKKLKGGANKNGNK
jgi:hypothetical protein